MWLPILGTVRVWGWKGTYGVCFTHALAHSLEVSETLIWTWEQRQSAIVLSPSSPFWPLPPWKGEVCDILRYLEEGGKELTQCHYWLVDTCCHFGINTLNLSTTTQFSVAETAVNNLAVLSCWTWLYRPATADPKFLQSPVEGLHVHMHVGMAILAQMKDLSGSDSAYQWS